MKPMLALNTLPEPEPAPANQNERKRRVRDGAPRRMRREMRHAYARLYVACEASGGDDADLIRRLDRMLA